MVRSPMRTIASLEIPRLKKVSSSASAARTSMPLPKRAAAAAYRQPVRWGPDRESEVVAIAHSIFCHTCQTALLARSAAAAPAPAAR